LFANKQVKFTYEKRCITKMDVKIEYMFIAKSIYMETQKMKNVGNQ
jgi:hypothetical protein